MNAKVIIVIVLFLVAVGGSLALALNQGGVEYRTLSQLQGDSYDGERVKVKAQVLDIESDFKPAKFRVVDIPDEGKPVPANAKTCHVVYEGDDVPGGLKKAAHVTMEGRYDSERGVFVATMLQTQCPSRYEGAGDPELKHEEPASP